MHNVITYASHGSLLVAMEIRNTCARKLRSHVGEYDHKMAGVGRIVRSVWPRISSAGAAGSSLGVERGSQLPRVLARAAGDEAYKAEPPPVAGT